MFRPRDSHDLRVLATDLDVSPDSSVRHDPGPALELGRAGPAAGARRHARDRLQVPDRARAQQQPRAAALAQRRDLSVLVHARGALRPRALPEAVSRRSRWRADRVGAPVHPHRRPDRHARAADRDEPAHPRQLPLPRPRRGRNAEPGRDAQGGQRLVPRLRPADDGSGTPARHRDALRLGLSVRPGARRRRRARTSPAPASPTPGCRRICRAPAGCRSIRPTTCSAARS